MSDFLNEILDENKLNTADLLLEHAESIIGNNIIHEVVYSVDYISGVVIIRWVNGKLHEVRKIENIYDY